MPRRRRRLRHVHLAVHDRACSTVGSHTVNIRAINAAGTRDPSPATSTFTVDLTAPGAPVFTVARRQRAADDLDRAPGRHGGGRRDGRHHRRRDRARLRGRERDGRLDRRGGRRDRRDARLHRRRDRPGRQPLRGRHPDGAGRHGRAGHDDRRRARTVPPATRRRPSRSPPTRPGPSSAASTAPRSRRARRRSPRPRSAAARHTVDVRAVDAAGNRDGTPASRGFSVDTSPPDTTLTPITTPGTDNTPTFTFTSEPGATFQCRIDGAAFAGVPDAVHHRAARRRHPHLRRPRRRRRRRTPIPRRATQTFVVDTTAPNTTLSAFSTPTNDTTPTFTLHVQRGRRDASSAASTAPRFAACPTPFTTGGARARARTRSPSAPATPPGTSTRPPRPRRSRSTRPRRTPS